MNTKDHTIMTKGRKEHPLVNTNQSKKDSNSSTKCEIY